MSGGRRQSVEVIAHRGYPERAPENTLASLALAIAAGAPAVEFDVHFTADGVPVLFHDFTLERTTGERGRVDETPLSLLLALDAGSWFDPAFVGERVPTLETALDLLGTHRPPRGPVRRVYPELKGWREPDDVEALCSMLDESAWSDDACLISLDWDALALVREHSDLEIGFVFDDARLFDDALELARADGNALVDPDYHILLEEPERIQAAREAGVGLACWTVDDVDDARRLVELGVRRLTTNYVGTMLRELEE